jgi:hypothetical protein
MESDLYEFIESSFTSIWQIELLVFLQRHADRAWSPAELVKELRGSDLVVAQSLERLRACGLVAGETDMSVRYGPASVELGRLAGAVERTYQEKPSAVRRAVLSRRDNKLHMFADAFKLKKD